METRNNQTVAFTGHRKERILQGLETIPGYLHKSGKLWLEW